MKTTTQQHKYSFLRPAMAACGVFLGMLGGQAGVAQRAAKTTVAAPQAAAAVPAATAFAAVPFSSLAPGGTSQTVKPAVEEEQESATPKKPGSEGIKVHGHWTIDVRNPDGTLDQHHEFENSLWDGGFNLAYFLAGYQVGGQNGILLGSQPGQAPCGAGQIQNCILTGSLESAIVPLFCPSYGVSSTCFYGMTSTVTSVVKAGLPVYSLTFSGQFTATNAGTINQVATYLGSCVATPSVAYVQSPAVVATISPSQCMNYPINNLAGTVYATTPTIYGTGNGFTSTTIAATAVAAGQTVQVNVILSFS